MSFYGDIQRWWVGTVVEPSGQTDPTGLGRCIVRIDGIHGPDIADLDLPYAQTIMPSISGGTSGIGDTPQLGKGARVIGFFLDGVMSQLPIIWGYLPFIGVPSIIQQEIIAKEKKPIIQTHTNKAIQTTPTNTANPSVALTNVEKAFNFFAKSGLTKRKYTQEQAAGIIGNLMQESTAALDPLIHEVGTGTATIDDKGAKTYRKGFGIAQWTKDADRYDGLKAFGKAKGKGSLGFTDFMVQLEYVDHELATLSWTRGDFFDCETVIAATMQFMRWYLRPEYFKEATILHTRSDGGKAPGKDNNNPIKRRSHEETRLENANTVMTDNSQGGNK